jgi:hypothetical protein
MLELVSGTQILEQLRVTVPLPEDRTWADVCAGAVNAGISARLADAPLVNPPPPELYAELSWAALTAGTEAYKRREAIFGLTGFVDMAGAAVRVSRDYLDSVAPIIARYATVGLA